MGRISSSFTKDRAIWGLYPLEIHARMGPRTIGAHRFGGRAPGGRGSPLKIQESAEDYLEAILIVREKKGSVRSIDVAHQLNFSKPSVSRAMSLLRENGYVKMDQDGQLTLTSAGREIAERIYERHRLLTQWLTALGVDPEVAAEDACRIEHDISDETFTRLKEHIAGARERSGDSQG